MKAARCILAVHARAPCFFPTLNRMKATTPMATTTTTTTTYAELGTLAKITFFICFSGIMCPKTKELFLRNYKAQKRKMIPKYPEATISTVIVTSPFSPALSAGHQRS